MNSPVDLLVVGAGPVGCTLAERAARLLGWRVVILEQRSHLAGNCYDATHPSGVLIHHYGPHYFRTDNDLLLKYLSRYTDWIPGNYIVKSSQKMGLVDFPINLNTLEKFFGRSLDEISARQLLERERIASAAPKNSEEFVLSRVGRKLYESFYEGYTLKQWGIHPRELAPSVCGRIPVRLDRDQRYVDQKHQFMPDRGFTSLFANMVDHPRIRVLTETAFDSVAKRISPRFATVYTGPIDDYFGRCFGPLPYRSLRFDYAVHEKEFVQPCVQINYPGGEPFTRTVEFKHVTRQVHAKSVVSYESSADSGEPFYPVPREDNQSLYERYRQLAEIETKERRVYFCGRLATYRYLNTDQVIESALDCFRKIKRRFLGKRPISRKVQMESRAKERFVRALELSQLSEGKSGPA